VIISTGLGIPKLPKFEPDALPFVNSELAKANQCAQLTRENKVVTVAQALARVDVADPLGEWRTLIDGKVDYPIVVVGFGNSALTFLEFIHSLGPDECYAYERVQRGALPKIFVISGKSAPSSPEEYQKQARPRYADLSSPMKSAMISVKAGYLIGVKPGSTEGVIEAIFKSGDGEVHSVPTNRIVLGTGYEISYAHLLPQHSPKTEVITGFPSDAKKEIPIAKKISGAEVYLVGAICGHDIVDPEYNVNGRVAIKEVGQVEALAFTSVLSREFGKRIGLHILKEVEAEREGGTLGSSVRVRFPREGEEEEREEVEAKEVVMRIHDGFTIRIPRRPTNNFLTLAQQAEPLTCVSLQLAQILSPVDFSDPELTEISFDFSVDPAYPNYLRVGFSPLTSIPATWLSSRILASAQLIDALLLVLHDGVQGVHVTFPLLASSSGVKVVAGNKSSVSLTDLPQGATQSYYLSPLTEEERSTRWHNHIDAENQDTIRDIVRRVQALHPTSQNKIYPIRDLLLCGQVSEPKFSGVYGDLPNFHVIKNAWEEAFTTGKMGEGKFDYALELDTLKIVSEYSPAMSEVEEDLYELSYDFDGNETVARDDGDTKGGLDWDLLPGWKERLIPNVPLYELHHAVDVTKINPHEKPFPMETLRDALAEAGFDIGGLFMFKKKGFWAYRTNEFSNETYVQAVQKLRDQAKRLRGIVTDLLSRSETTGCNETGKLPPFTSACSLEAVHAIWKF
jgi:hypothetical protein